MRRALVAALAAFVLGGCGTIGAGESGKATLWITRDEGHRVLYQGTVPAGLTVMQALDKVADVKTRYGGRFVQAIDGLGGSATRGDDWFFYVNGVAADRGAADYRLHAGEIAWWDYRRWAGLPEVRVVVGAFPEPFVHGYAGRRRTAHVRYERAADAAVARRLGRIVHAASVRPAAVAVPPGANALVVSGRAAGLRATATSAGGPYRFVMGGAAARRLARDPRAARFRYEGLP